MNVYIHKDENTLFSTGRHVGRHISVARGSEGKSYGWGGCEHRGVGRGPKEHQGEVADPGSRRTP